MGGQSKSWFLKSYFAAAVFYFLLFYVNYYFINPVNSEGDGRVLFLVIVLAMSLFWPVIAILFGFIIPVFFGMTISSESTGPAAYLVLLIGPFIVFYIVSKSAKGEKILGQNPSLSLVITVVIAFLSFAFSL